VAPGAKWIHAAVIDRVSIQQTVADALAAFEWTADPDGNPNTHWDVPDTSSNSWGLVTSFGYPPCDQTFWNVLDNVQATGVIVFFSAGNEGSGGLRRPGDRAWDEYRTSAVAAVDGNNPSYPIAGFSSRGPTNCTPDGSSAIKPDIAAPGVSVRSSVPGNGYSNFSGTSMASPHVNGVAALMRAANPEITPEQVMQIMYDTAQDLGTNGKDNSYGHGMIDAYECVLAALNTVSLTFNFENALPEFVDPNGGTTVRFEIAGNATPNPASARLFYRTGVNFAEIPVENLFGDTYQATFPGFACGADVDYYFAIETVDGDVVTNPFSAPDTFHQTRAYTGLDIQFEDNFENDLGWSITSDPGLSSGEWERVVPNGGGGRCDPANDADQSGRCFVTENGNGDFDIDGGETTLTSPVMDASDPEIAISYNSWFANTCGAAPESDIMLVEVSDNGGASWVTLELIGPSGPEINGGWFEKEFLVADIPGITNSDQFRIRFTAGDTGDGSVVEAGVDAVQLRKLFCDPGLDGDLDNDGDVDVDDLLALLANWGPCGVQDCIGDINGDNTVGVDDLLTLLANYTA